MGEGECGFLPVGLAVGVVCASIAGRSMARTIARKSPPLALLWVDVDPLEAIAGPPPSRTLPGMAPSLSPGLRPARTELHAASVMFEPVKGADATDGRPVGSTAHVWAMSKAGTFTVGFIGLSSSICVVKGACFRG